MRETVFNSMSRPKEYGFKQLLESEHSWQSNMGGSILGERVVFRGKDVFSEFKDWSWIEMLYFCVSGNQPSNESIKFLNGLYCMCFNYPDPRIWCNRVAALAGTASSTAQLGVSAGSSATEAQIYGGPTGLRAMDFLFRLKNDLGKGLSISEVVRKEIRINKVVFGYGRPILPIDERVKPALELLAELNLHEREYLLLALEVEKYLISSRYKLHLNIAGVFAAFCADDGLKRDDIYYLTTSSFSIGMLACYIEANDKPEGALFPLRCKSISYEGANSRQW